MAGAVFLLLLLLLRSPSTHGTSPATSPSGTWPTVTTDSQGNLHLNASALTGQVLVNGAAPITVGDATLVALQTQVASLLEANRALAAEQAAMKELVESLVNTSLGLEASVRTLTVQKNELETRVGDLLKAVFPKRLYIIGGARGINSGVLDSVAIYDGEAWTAGPAMPFPTYEHKSVVFNNTLMVIGGRVGPGPVNTTYYFDGVDWSAGPELQTYHYSFAAVVYHNQVHVIGMASSNANNPKNEVLIDGVWTQGANSVFFRFAPCAAVYRDRLFVMGGQTSTGVLSSIEVLDTDTNTWILYGNLLSARMACAAIVFDDILYVIGGQDDSGEYLNTVESFNGETWSVVAAMHQGRAYMSANIFRSTISVIGGEGSESDRAHTTVETFDGAAWSVDADLAIDSRTRFASAVFEPPVGQKYDDCARHTTQDQPFFAATEGNNSFRETIFGLQFGFVLFRGSSNGISESLNPEDRESATRSRPQVSQQRETTVVNGLSPQAVFVFEAQSETLCFATLCELCRRTSKTPQPRLTREHLLTCRPIKRHNALRDEMGRLLRYATLSHVWVEKSGYNANALPDLGIDVTVRTAQPPTTSQACIKVGAALRRAEKEKRDYYTGFNHGKTLIVPAAMTTTGGFASSFVDLLGQLARCAEARGVYQPGLDEAFVPRWKGRFAALVHQMNADHIQRHFGGVCLHSS
ncbi:uncharacterized protein MONBRDRAFT_28407 [Monosiga brevicollis MX1]|uniref:Uncharacterized protein n=1 Tax=Monosiga brevicollis TaxID=81824 RepID=A9V832_MONBE|nr:uncharacterized protein MONBRDRAFT_28407 [Monosiga brevicollis MX1]EDQ86199.1 predicted protein [Monosiga brevicollis MX1]|eukprot:XP_001748869.1 hypothetical protein [Monosiga brevicollis MX1]